jgi:hypothetical protein
VITSPYPLYLALHHRLRQVIVLGGALVGSGGMTPRALAAFFFYSQTVVEAMQVPYGLRHKHRCPRVATG